MACLRKTPRLPQYSEKKGWHGGDRKTLFALTDKRTGKVMVRPAGFMRGIGSEADIRVATKEEAKTLWQDPLHPGWKVSC